jgi:hypothetical protein
MRAGRLLNTVFSDGRLLIFASSNRFKFATYVLSGQPNIFDDKLITPAEADKVGARSDG